MSKELSSKIKNISVSKSVLFANEIEILRGKGETIISLNVGEPDFLPSNNILKATQNAIEAGKVSYASVLGELELRELISEKLLRDNGVVAPPEQIVVSNGSKHSIYNTFQALLNKGDEVIVPTPYWVTIPESVSLAGGIPIFVDCHKKLDVEKIKGLITKKTKAIFINTPNNPSGIVYSKEELTLLGELAIENDLYIVSDESYEAFTYEDHKHISIASLSSEIAERTITLQSFSKSFAMTGYRIGYMAANKEIISMVTALQSHLCGNPCTFAQYGAIEALRNKDKFLESNLAIFKKRQELAYRLFSEIFELERPQGAFYLYPDVSNLLKKHNLSNSNELATMILKKTGVAVLSGTVFGSPNHLRICYANSEENITKAYELMKEVL